MISDGTDDPVAEPHWLLRARVAVPAQPSRFCDRGDLAVRCVTSQCASTVLMAPAGFGKTTLLAAACRDAMRAGVPVAWLTLSDDDPATLDTYLAFAFRHAGLVVPDRAPASPVDALHPRTAAVLHGIDARGTPCVLVLDELECVANPDSVALLNNLLRHAPPCLHLALAYRRLPAGLDAVESLLAQGAVLITAADLRFSTADVARFFDLALSQRQLAALVTWSSGWPIALQMFRNAPGERSAGEEPVARDAVWSWIAGRFWRGFETQDRDLVLDLALFDWLDADLVEEVLEEPGALARASALPGLDGLLCPAGGRTPGVYRLHPLLRERFAEERRRGEITRWRHVHRRLAAALSRRGATVEAMRHAAEVGDAPMAGEILLDAGGVQWWLREGSDRLAAADRYLTDAVVAANPRLAMTRSLALLFDGQPPEANRVFDRASCDPPQRQGHAIDRLVAHAMLLLTGSRPFSASATAALVEDARRVAAFPGTPRVARGAIVLGLAAHRVRLGEFESADLLASQARQMVAGRSAYLTLWTDTLLGQWAMARGRVSKALEHYRNARRVARERFLEDPRMGAVVDVYTRELALERNRLIDHPDPDQMVRIAYRVATRSPYYITAASLAADLALAERGVDPTLSLLGDIAELAHGAGIDVLVRHLAALRVSILADAGRFSEAELEWSAADLPRTPEACLDMYKNTWRGTEALACARIRLLAGLGDTAAAVALEGALAALATERGLRRMLFRSLALRVRLRHDWRDPDGARDAAAEYLRLFRTTDYARPLLREGEACTDALERTLDADSAGPDASAARRLLEMARVSRAEHAPSFTSRQMAVLHLLATCQDKEIARSLGLSIHGVRYHLRNIYHKLAVRRREDAVQRAGALGMLSDADGSPDE